MITRRNFFLNPVGFYFRCTRTALKVVNIVMEVLKYSTNNFKDFLGFLACLRHSISWEAARNFGSLRKTASGRNGERFEQANGLLTRVTNMKNLAGIIIDTSMKVCQKVWTSDRTV